MPHPDDEKVTMSPKELEAAYRAYWDEYMTEFRKIAEQHKDDLNAVSNPTAEEIAGCKDK